MRLIVDLRRAADSGLGTYIRETVPRTLRLLALPAADVGGLVTAGGHASARGIARGWLDGVGLTEIDCPAAPLSLAEQPALRRLLACASGAQGHTPLFWATTLAHPLGWRGPLVASVHDLMQLALPTALAGGAAVRLAVRLHFANLRRHARVLLFNSHFTAAEFERRAGRPRGRIVVAPLGVDATWWSAPALDDGGGGGAGGDAVAVAREEPPCFIFVGNVKPHKNLGVLLDAFDMVAPAVAQSLVLIGERSDFRSAGTGDAALDRRIDTAAAAVNDTRARVRHLGRLPDVALRRRLSAATALVLPSLHEGFGLPALEAMAVGCPVVAADAAALPETCAGHALLFDPHDPQALARRLREVAGWSAAQRAAHIAAAREHAHAQSWDRTAESSAAALAPLLGGMPAAARQRPSPSGAAAPRRPT